MLGFEKKKKNPKKNTDVGFSFGWTTVTVIVGRNCSSPAPPTTEEINELRDGKTIKIRHSFYIFTTSNLDFILSTCTEIIKRTTGIWRARH